MNLDEDIIQKDLSDLLVYFSKRTYSASSSDERALRILERCIDLFVKDYEISILMNGNGELCGHYPQRIIIVESEIVRGEKFLAKASAKINDISQLKPLIGKARLARCRSRFVVPVISFDGKNICRSATLASFAEIVGRSGFNFLFSSPVFPEDELLEDPNSSEWDLLHKSRCHDIQLLKTLRVKYIFDLMLENKKVKYGMRVTSSEKVDKENRYEEFCLCCIPYPGCEFFRILKSKDYVSQRVHFDWSQNYVDADLNLPNEIEMQVDCDWKRYQRWDLATLTQNYFLLLLKTIIDNDDGVLVHCISGWDRTPMFVSLLRLSLWADGKIHESLNALEILYLTIAYDWLLFGHDLNDRMQRDEEVFFFCFHFLRYIMSDTYSVTQLGRCNNSSLRHRNVDNSSSRSSSPEDRDNVCSNNYGVETPLETNCRGYFIGQHPTEDVQENCASESNVLRVGHKNGSNPLPVPGKNSVGKNAQCYQHSLNAGSWQLVSGPDSFSARGSHGICSSLTNGLEENGNSLSSCEEAVEESVRRTRLEAVRSIFLDIYKDTLGDETQSNNGTFSKIFDQVTDRFKTPWAR